MYSLSVSECVLYVKCINGLLQLKVQWEVYFYRVKKIRVRIVLTKI